MTPEQRKTPLGPHRVEIKNKSGATIRTYYVRLPSVNEFKASPVANFTDEVTFEQIRSWPALGWTMLHTRLDEETYAREVAEAKAANSRRSKEEQAREAQKVENRVYGKDWQRWYERFLADGYTADEATYKATRIMGPRY